MKSLCLALAAAVLTIGTAAAQPPPPAGNGPWTVYETEESTMMVSKDGCMIKSKIVNQTVGTVRDGSTVILSDGMKVVILPTGELTAIDSPYPSPDLRKLLTAIANNSQRACANAIRTIGR